MNIFFKIGPTMYTAYITNTDVAEYSYSVLSSVTPGKRLLVISQYCYRNSVTVFQILN